jgi:hypothetical protein
MRRILWFVFFWSLLNSGVLVAETSSFDLLGPKVDVHVKRGDQTLPISAVPNLQPGDRLWVHPDLPESQSARFVLVIAFLRGATNPPPPEWFTRVETWNKEVRNEGVFITVPDEAQQAILFLAPETGGDFSTLRNAVRGRPGAFVRATQDLQMASWDRLRLESYLSIVKANAQADPKILKARTESAAHSLGIKLDQQCFDKPTEQQAPCLSANTDNTVLDDSNANSMLGQWTSGDTRDLMSQISSTPMVGAGAYSPYVGAIVDTARILSSLHTAHFQYIPALALPVKDTLNLRLSVPPSFRDPKSVVVIALPPVASVHLPQLRPVNPAEVACVQKPSLVLPAEGAPLVFATAMARDLVLHIEAKSGPVDLKVQLDPAQGGLVPESPAPQLGNEEVTAVLRGKWGFDPWEGPRFKLRSVQSGKWSVAPADQSALVVGREDMLHLEAGNTACLDHLELQAGTAAPVKLLWKSARPEALEVTVPLKEAAPGAVTLNVFQYGLEKPDSIALRAYAEAAALEKLTIHAGDQQATLKGNRLDEVAGVKLGEIAWTPTTLSRVQDFDQLTLTTTAFTNTLDAGKKLTAAVQLRDGRELKVPVSVEPARPQLTLLSKGVQEEAGATPSPVHLGSEDDLPLTGRLVFFLRSNHPARFPRTQKIEVAAEDGSFHTLLSFADSSLILEDARTALGIIDPLARFGASAFGPLRLRALSAEGAASDWMDLGTLVRLPVFRELRCPHLQTKPCTLTGSNLFLATAFSATSNFDNPSEVPDEFTGTQLSVPHPVNGQLYMKLRDDPDVVQTLNLAITPISAAPPAAAVSPIAVPVAVPQAPAQQTLPATPATEPLPAPAPQPVATPAAVTAPAAAPAAPVEAPAATPKP